VAKAEADGEKRTTNNYFQKIFENKDVNQLVLTLYSIINLNKKVKAIL
jgi:hypothetical protein